MELTLKDTTKAFCQSGLVSFCRNCLKQWMLEVAVQSRGKNSTEAIRKQSTALTDCLCFELASNMNITEIPKLLVIRLYYQSLHGVILFNSDVNSFPGISLSSCSGISHLHSHFLLLTAILMQSRFHLFTGEKKVSLAQLLSVKLRWV